MNFDLKSLISGVSKISEYVKNRNLEDTSLFLQEHETNLYMIYGFIGNGQFDLNDIKFLYQAGLNINDEYIEYIGKSPEAVEWLSTVSQSSKIGKLACEYGMTSLVEKLLDQFEEEWLLSAVKFDEIEIMKILPNPIEKKLTKNIITNVKSSKALDILLEMDYELDESIFISVCQNGRFSVLLHLVDLGFDYQKYITDVFSKFESRTDTSFISNFLNINNLSDHIKNNKDFKSLKNEDDYLKTIEWLHEHGAELTIDNMLYACKVGDLTLAKFLYDNGVQVNEECYKVAANSYQKTITQWLDTLEEMSRIEFKKENPLNGYIDGSIADMFGSIFGSKFEEFGIIDKVGEMIPKLKEGEDIDFGDIISNIADNKNVDKLINQQETGVNYETLDPEADLDDI